MNTPCPFCGASPVVDETCPGSCGSLEGTELVAHERRRLFGYDWAQGYVAPFLGIDRHAVSQALTAAAVTAADVLVDLGSGDGRICRVAAADYGATAVGYELDAALLQQARDANVDFIHQVSFHRQDLLTVNLQSYSVVTVFLLPETLDRLAHSFRTVLERGGRVVSFGWKIHKLGEPSYQHDKKFCSVSNTTDGASSSSSNDYGGLLTSWFVYSPSHSGA